MIASKGEVRNVTCNLAWTSPTANTRLQENITLELVQSFAMDMYMSNDVLQPSASVDKVEDAAADDVESPEPAMSARESLNKKRVLHVPKLVPKFLPHPHRSGFYLG